MYRIQFCDRFNTRDTGTTQHASHPDSHELLSSPCQLLKKKIKSYQPILIYQGGGKVPNPEIH